VVNLVTPRKQAVRPGFACGHGRWLFLNAAAVNIESKGSEMFPELHRGVQRSLPITAMFFFSVFTLSTNSLSIAINQPLMTVSAMIRRSNHTDQFCM
jgi:hypothetical protein